VKLNGQQPIFVGLKLDGQLRRLLEGLSGADRRYVSRENSTFLRICKLGDVEYVGKVIPDGLSTDRINDVRRNVISILQRLCPDTRFPEHLQIYPCDTREDNEITATPGTGSMNY
jgi:hypothetical protein